MNRIISHIENLLLCHDCVIVPGIGGFITHFEEAFFSDYGNEIYPPYCSVSFNAHLSDKEDKYGMLTQSYMTAYDINYPKALALVNDDVAEMRELLRSNMELQIGTIGTLQLTLNYSLMFTPSDECGLFAKEFYGLVQAPLPSEAHRVALSQSTYTASPAGPETNKPQTTKTIYNDNTHYVIRVSKNAVRYTVTTIAAALLYFMFTIAPNVEPVIDNSVQQAGIIITKPQSNKATKTQSTATPNSATLQLRESATPNSSTLQLRDSETSKPLFTLVLASKVTAKGASHLVQELKESGFSEAQVIDDDGMTRVIYSTYPTDNDAYMAAKQLRTQHKSFRSAWVMQMEK